MAGGSGSDSDSDTPEEYTAEQGLKQDEEIRKVQIENKRRVALEGKERRRQWAKRKTQVESSKHNAVEDDEQEQQEKPSIPGMLPSNIVNFLAAREKQTFSSDSEDEVIDRKPTTRKKKQKTTGFSSHCFYRHKRRVHTLYSHSVTFGRPETVLLKGIPPAHCLQRSMEFLKKRKMQVPRSKSVLKNPNQALRLLSSQGTL